MSITSLSTLICIYKLVLSILTCIKNVLFFQQKYFSLIFISTLLLSNPRNVFLFYSAYSLELVLPCTFSTCLFKHWEFFSHVHTIIAFVFFLFNKYILAIPKPFHQFLDLLKFSIISSCCMNSTEAFEDIFLN